LTEFAWLAKQVSAGAVYPFCKLRKKNTANRKAAMIQHSNTVGHKRNETVVAGVKRVNLPLVNKPVTAEDKKSEIELAAKLMALLCDPTAQQQLLINIRFFLIQIKMVYI